MPHFEAIFVTDLEEPEARNDCAREGQQQFNPPTDRKQDGAESEEDKTVALTKIVLKLMKQNGR
jgi:hypothetical protein